jgi:hypothetical protein
MWTDENEDIPGEKASVLACSSEEEILICEVIQQTQYLPTSKDSVSNVQNVYIDTVFVLHTT